MTQQANMFRLNSLKSFQHAHQVSPSLLKQYDTNPPSRVSPIKCVTDVRMRIDKCAKHFQTKQANKHYNNIKIGELCNFFEWEQILQFHSSSAKDQFLDMQRSISQLFITEQRRESL